jgi:hypothetical protein
MMLEKSVTFNWFTSLSSLCIFVIVEEEPAGQPYHNSYSIHKLHPPSHECNQFPTNPFLLVGSEVSASSGLAPPTPCEALSSTNRVHSSTSWSDSVLQLACISKKLKMNDRIAQILLPLTEFADPPAYWEHHYTQFTITSGRLFALCRQHTQEIKRHRQRRCQLLQLSPFAVNSNVLAKWHTMLSVEQDLRNRRRVIRGVTRRFVIRHAMVLRMVQQAEEEIRRDSEDGW